MTTRRPAGNLTIFRLESAVRLVYWGQLQEDSTNRLAADMRGVLDQIRTGQHPYGGCTPHPPPSTQSGTLRSIRRGQRRTRAAVLRSEWSRPKRTCMGTQKYIFGEDSHTLPPLSSKRCPRTMLGGVQRTAEGQGHQ